MSHRIGTPIEKKVEFRHPEIEADGYVRCFPNGWVQYRLDILRSSPGSVYRFNLQAVFLRKGRQTNASQQAVFYSNSDYVRGIPQGDKAYTGKTQPSPEALTGVDDFTVNGGVSRQRHLG